MQIKNTHWHTHIKINIDTHRVHVKTFKCAKKKEEFSSKKSPMLKAMIYFRHSQMHQKVKRTQTTCVRLSFSFHHEFCCLFRFQYFCCFDWSHFYFTSWICVCLYLLLPVLVCVSGNILTGQFRKLIDVTENLPSHNVQKHR